MFTWLFPNKRNVTPRYDQIAIRQLAKKNSLYQVLSPSSEDDGVWIHQQAWFNIGEYDVATEEKYTLNLSENGVYLFVIDGQLTIENQTLEKRDGFGIWNWESTIFIRIDLLSLLLFLLLESRFFFLFGFLKFNTH